MNSRERVKAALEHQEPDQVPVDLGGSVGAGQMSRVDASIVAEQDWDRQRSMWSTLPKQNVERTPRLRKP